MTKKKRKIVALFSHGKHGNHGKVFLNTNCRYDDTQSTQMGADCAEKWEHEFHELTRIVFDQNRETPDEMVLRTCIMLLIQKDVSKLPPFS